MKIKQYIKLEFLSAILCVLLTLPMAHAQTQKDLEKEVEKIFEESAKKHLKEIEEMMEKKEADRKAIEKGDPVTILKEIHLSLMHFEEDYQSFPDESIIDSNDEFQVVNQLAKNSSNRYFGLLFASGYAEAKSETHFSLAFDAIKVTKSDNVVTKGKILEAGECSLTYNRGLVFRANAFKFFTTAMAKAERSTGILPVFQYVKQARRLCSYPLNSRTLILCGY